MRLIRNQCLDRSCRSATASAPSASRWGYCGCRYKAALPQNAGGSLIVARSNLNSADEKAQSPLEASTPHSEEPSSSTEEQDSDLQKFMRVVLLNGLNFLIVFVAAFMLPSILPRDVQSSLGLTSIATIATIAVVVAVAVTAAASGSAGTKEDK